MSESALVRPVGLETLLLQRLDHDARDALEGKAQEVVSRARAAKPEPGSEEERWLVEGYARVFADLLRSSGPLDAALQDDLGGQLDSLILQEYAAADVLEKLAYRHLGTATSVVGRLFEIYRRGGVLENIDELLAEALSGDAGASKVPEGGEVSAWLRGDAASYHANCILLFVAVALDSSEDSAAELARWAKRAVEASRELDAELPAVARLVDAVATRWRAERAWLNWDDAEADSEMSSWKSLVE